MMMMMMMMMMMTMMIMMMRSISGPGPGPWVLRHGVARSPGQGACGQHRHAAPRLPAPGGPHDRGPP
eukprot:5410576-Karenia_brevis.AAC.1